MLADCCFICEPVNEPLPSTLVCYASVCGYKSQAVDTLEEGMVRLQMTATFPSLPFSPSSVLSVLPSLNMKEQLLYSKISVECLRRNSPAHVCKKNCSAFGNVQLSSHQAEIVTEVSLLLAGKASYFLQIVRNNLKFYLFILREIM